MRVLLDAAPSNNLTALRFHRRGQGWPSLAKKKTARPSVDRRRGHHENQQMTAYPERKETQEYLARIDLRLSGGARRLVDELLRRRAFSADTAATDREIAIALGVRPRVLSDWAAAAITAGVLVVARSRAPYGRWIVAEAGRLCDARRYARSLRARAAEIDRRADGVDRAIAGFANATVQPPAAAEKQMPLFAAAVPR